MNKAAVSILDCKDYTPGLVQDSVEQAVKLLGGISAFIKPGSKVLVKPNLLMAKEPEFGITTHPEVLRAVLKILKSIDCKICVGDGPSVWGNQIEDVGRVYLCSGAKKVCDEEKVEIFEFDKRRMRQKFPLTTLLDECDYLINLPKFKTHEFTLLTGAIKNLFGLVPGTYKTELHKNYHKIEDFSGILVDIYQEVKPTLTIIDGIVAMEGNGPATSGKAKNLGLILAGTDCVALDSILALIMGIDPFSVLTTKEAANRGLGIADIKCIDILGKKISDIKDKKFILPTSSGFRKNIPPVLIKIIKKIIRYYPIVNHKKCIKCLACVKACPAKIISLRKKKISFDYRGCIACFCCQEVCPEGAINTRRSFFAKAIGL